MGDIQGRMVLVVDEVALFTVAAVWEGGRGGGREGGRMGGKVRGD